jgi:regulator of sigma D
MIAQALKTFGDESIIYNWLHNRNNTVFNYPEFEGIKNEAGLNRFTLSVKKWIEKTNAVGLLAKTGQAACRAGED